MQTDYTLNDGRAVLAVRDGIFVTPGGGRPEPLPGAYVGPAFVDCHCHVLPAGLHLHSLDLRGTTSHEEVLDRVAQRHRDQPDGWLLAVQYDQNRFADGRHLTAAQLDAITKERPVVLRHFNGHAGVANSAALAAAGVGPDTPDPSGGVYRRGPDGRPDGVLLEHALDHVMASSPAPDLEQMVAAILAAGESMASMGVGTATDMMTGYVDLETELTAYRLASERGCAVRLRLFVQWRDLFGRRAMPQERLREHLAAMDPARCRVEGAKIFSDGAIASGTAAIHGEFKTGGSGQLIYSPERLHEMVRVADEAGWRIAVHSIGDRATDHVADAFSQTQDPTRHRIEHAMILSDAQIDRLAKLGAHVAMQPEFLVQNGVAYRKQLADHVSPLLNRTRSVLDAGISLSLSSDRPVVAGDPLVGVRAAVDRPEGFDPREDLTWDEALSLYTAGASDANGDTGQGRLDEGCRADFAVFDRDVRDGGTCQALWVAGKPVWRRRLD
ncbi:MAG: amidohydrolase [Fimbriimonadaceae bacterium]|nr:amidohydrolase [Fimbriimonadaceae bacterium]